MRKNVASQSIGCQMITAADGTNFTGTVTVYITINGTQTLGTVGSGVCTHEGNGYHSYAPSQAETNANHIAFTFVGTGAISVTVQVFTISFDPHDTAGLGLSRLDAAMTSRMATYTQPTGFLAATFPATVASTTNITAGTITTVTNLTNAPTSGDLTATMKASVNAEVDTALEVIGLDHLVQVAVTGTDVTDNSIIARLVSKSATADWDTFVHTTDSLEAIRDQGDAAWVTGAGGDPWATALPGAYGAGSAGYIIGTNLNATVSSRATQTSVDTVDTNVDAILVDTDTTIPGLIAAVQADTDNIQTRIPAALVSGRMDASVGAMAANVITATAIAADAITAGKIAADAIGASELATDAVEEIADQVWNEILAGHLGAGSTGEALNAAGAAGDPWTTSLPGAYGAGSAGYIIGTNINATVSSRATQTSVDTVDTNVDAILVDTNTTIPGLIAAVQADTDNIQTRIPAALVSGRMDASVGAMAANVVTSAAIAADAIGASELATDAVEEIADQVWNELLSGHLGVGSTGEALNAAGAAGDPWTTTLPGAYGAGSAGYIIGTNINATVGSRATQTSVDTVDTNVDAILVDTDTTIPGLIAAVQADTDNIQTRIPAALVSGRMDSSVGAMAANVLTATAIAADAITAAKIAADAIGASELAADAVAEIQSGLATSAALATVQADTDNIQTRLPAALVGGRMDSNVGSIDSQTSGVASFQRSVASIVRVTVAAGSTATVIQTSSLSPAVVDADQWKGKVLTFDDQTTTAALRGQAATVTAVDSGTGAITVATGELTRGPAPGDTATLG